MIATLALLDSSAHNAILGINWNQVFWDLLVAQAVGLMLVFPIQVAAIVGSAKVTTILSM